MKFQGSVINGLVFFGFAVILYMLYLPLSVEAIARAALDGDYVYYALTGVVFISIICLSVLAALNFHGSVLRMPVGDKSKDKGYVCDYCNRGPTHAEDNYCRFCGERFTDSPPF